MNLQVKPQIHITSRCFLKLFFIQFSVTLLILLVSRPGNSSEAYLHPDLGQKVSANMRDFWQFKNLTYL